jgi:small subunit ribosomal protein S13
MALTGIKGVGRRCARIFTDKAGVDPYATLGLLPDAEIDKLKKVIEEDANKILPPGWSTGAAILKPARISTSWAWTLP